MTKLYENCQRMISIAYANEMADACTSHGIDPLEVCKAAGTKPFGYQPYTPGLGVGGHCIPVNPFYLLSNSPWPFLEMATKKMRNRPADLGDRIIADLRANLPPSKRPRILVAGVSFKKGQSVLSNAPGIDLIVHLLSTYDVYIEFADPLVDETELSYVPKLEHSTGWNVENLDESFDAVVVAIAQDGLDLTVLQSLEKAKVFNFTSALPWSSPDMLAEPPTPESESGQWSTCPSGSSSLTESESATPTGSIFSGQVETGFIAGAEKLIRSIADLERGIIQVWVDHKEVQ